MEADLSRGPARGRQARDRQGYGAAARLGRGRQRQRRGLARGRPELDLGRPDRVPLRPAHAARGLSQRPDPQRGRQASRGRARRDQLGSARALACTSATAGGRADGWRLRLRGRHGRRLRLRRSRRDGSTGDQGRQPGRARWRCRDRRQSRSLEPQRRDRRHDDQLDDRCREPASEHDGLDPFAADLWPDPGRRHGPGHGARRDLDHGRADQRAGRSRGDLPLQARRGRLRLRGQPLSRGSVQEHHRLRARAGPDRDLLGRLLRRRRALGGGRSRDLGHDPLRGRDRGDDHLVDPILGPGDEADSDRPRRARGRELLSEHHDLRRARPGQGSSLQGPDPPPASRAELRPGQAARGHRGSRGRLVGPDHAAGQGHERQLVPGRADALDADLGDLGRAGARAAQQIPRGRQPRRGRAQAAAADRRPAPRDRQDRHRGRWPASPARRAARAGRADPAQPPGDREGSGRQGSAQQAQQAARGILE